MAPQGFLARVVAAAVADGRLSQNPLHGLELPKIEREEMRFLSPSEVATLADTIGNRPRRRHAATDPTGFRALVILGAYGGLRLGEMFALRWKHVDLLRGRVEVLATLSEVRGELIENPPKTRAGQRAVPLPRVALDALTEHLRSGDGHGYVFRAEEGGPVRASGWRRRVWAPAVERAGLTPLRPHDLRHTAVALWIAAGASPREIAARAGHSSVVTVLDRYGHLLPGSEDRVNDALDALALAAKSAATARVVALATASA